MDISNGNHSLVIIQSFENVLLFLFFFCRDNLQGLKAWKHIASKWRAYLLDGFWSFMLNILQTTGNPSTWNFLRLFWQLCPVCSQKYDDCSLILQLLIPSTDEKKRKKKRQKSQQTPIFMAEPMRASNSFVGTEEYIAPVGFSYPYPGHFGVIFLVFQPIKNLWFDFTFCTSI